MDQYPGAARLEIDAAYVALTRAKKMVYLLTAGSNISSFAQDLITKYSDEIKKEPWSCPLCGGHLKKVDGPYGEFYGCVNYQATGCSYKRKIVRRSETSDKGSAG